MTEIRLAILTAGAFAYAVWLVVSRQEPSPPGYFEGTRRRFALATLLFIEVLAAPKAAKEDSRPSRWKKIEEGFRAAWRALDPEQSEGFQHALEVAAAKGAIKPDVADLLAMAYAQLDYHWQRTRTDWPNPMLYSMSELGGMPVAACENALNQIKLLAKARVSGAIDKDTIATAHAALARDLEMLCRLGQLRPPDMQTRVLLIEQYQNKTLDPGYAASVSAALMIEAEGGVSILATATERFAAMRESVEQLLGEGPPLNDWNDPAIQPNINAILVKAGLSQSDESFMTCYQRLAMPTRARSEELNRLQQDLLKDLPSANVLDVEVASRVAEEETGFDGSYHAGCYMPASLEPRSEQLKRLQQELLQEQVEAGVLDPETVDRAAAATVRESRDIYVDNADVRAYQRKVRRAARLLYDHGEIPSSLVRKLAQAAEIDMIIFDSHKALRNDMGYYLRALGLWQPAAGKCVLEALEARGLIPPARNARHVIQPMHGVAQDVETAQERVAEFVALIDGERAIELPDDADAVVSRQEYPALTGYRRRMHKVCRALVKTELAPPEWLREIEILIGAPILGVLEDK